MWKLYCWQSVGHYLLKEFVYYTTRTKHNIITHISHTLYSCFPACRYYTLTLTYLIQSYRSSYKLLWLIPIMIEEIMMMNQYIVLSLLFQHRGIVDRNFKWSLHTMGYRRFVPISSLAPMSELSIDFRQFLVICTQNGQ